jgi:hypothetical protein
VNIQLTEKIYYFSEVLWCIKCYVIPKLEPMIFYDGICMWVLSITLIILSNNLMILWALEYVYGNVKCVMFLDDFK